MYPRYKSLFLAEELELVDMLEDHFKMEEQYLRSRAYQLRQDLILDTLRYGTMSQVDSDEIMNQNIQSTRKGPDILFQKRKIEIKPENNEGMFQRPAGGI